MAVWGFQTYKKDEYRLQAEQTLKFRKYVSSRVYVWNAARTTELPHVQFVLSSNAKLKAILKGYFRQVGAEPTRFINLLWKKSSGYESVESFLGENELNSFYGMRATSFHSLENLGDFLLAGRSLCDAFDIYSCSIYIRMNLMGRDYFLEEMNLIGLVIKCGRSAESNEQKKLATELLELSLVNQSITGILKDTVSKSLRQYYADKIPGQKCHIEPHVGSCPEDMVSRLYRRILPTSISTYTSISSLLVVTKPSELYLPTQHAIYAHLWQRLHIDFSDLYLRDTDTQEPNLQLCEILATSSHVLAQNMLERNLGKLFGSSETSGSISVYDTLSRMFQSEVCSTDILEKIHPTTKSEEVCFVDSLQARYRDDRYVHPQCTQWIQTIALASIDSCASLSIARDLPPSVALRPTILTRSTANSSDEPEAMEVDVTDSSHNNGLDSAPIDMRSSESSKSVYLCSSSMLSSMHSMLSMASRIRRNNRESTLLGVSQMSSSSMTMSISGSFDFSRVTGMGSATLPDHSRDIMETDEDSTFENGSDAPLTSLDMATFQLMPHMPSMAYLISTDMTNGQYRPFLSSLDKSEVSPTLSDPMKTEFFIHEFPGQKEEHAHVVQQLAQQKPKSYVFANVTPNDY